MKEKSINRRFSDEELREELEFRGYEVYSRGELEDIVCGKEDEETFSLKKDFLGYELRDHLLNITGQGGFVNDDALFNRLKELIK